jgi:hypothetical protein
MNEGDGHLRTSSALEQLREASKSLWGASSAAYFRVDALLRQLANPNLQVSRWDVGRIGYSLGYRGIGQRRGWTCGNACCHCEPSGSAVHVAEWDIGD